MAAPAENVRKDGRVRLGHGVARVRFYPLGYTGEIKIKLGRKWYEVWNEYNLILGASK